MAYTVNKTNNSASVSSYIVQDSVLNITEFDTLLTKEFKHKHSITQNDFDLTIDYYFENIEELDLLYQEILDSIIMLEMN